MRIQNFLENRKLLFVDKNVSNAQICCIGFALLKLSIDGLGEEGGARTASPTLVHLSSFSCNNFWKKLAKY